MEPAERLRAKLMELTRLEDRVLLRNPEEAALPERREEMLAYLMTERERFDWRRTKALVAEMRKFI